MTPRRAGSVTSKTKHRTERVSLERRTYREMPSGKYHIGLVDGDGNIFTKVTCPARGPLVDVNDNSGNVPDVLICPTCFVRDL